MPGATNRRSEQRRSYARDWLQHIIRWVHLITGIAWIGASFYFVWLDNHLQPPQDTTDAGKGIGGAMIAFIALTASGLSHLFSGRAM
jgi:uncharacterized membrane protein